MSQQTNSQTDSQTLDSVISHSEQMIGVAKSFNGRAYGGYVRDVVISRELDMPPVLPKDVDLWFSLSSDARGFVNAMGKKLQPVPSDLKAEYPIAGSGFGEFKREQYLLNPLGHSINVDIIISENIPVNDYNVNKILYTGSPINFPKNGKKARMLHNYLKFLASADLEMLDVHQKRFEKLLSRGWIVYDPDRKNILQKWEDIMYHVTEYQRVLYSIKALDVSYDNKVMLAAVVRSIDDLIKELPVGCNVTGDYLFSVGNPVKIAKISPFDHIDIIMNNDQRRLFTSQVKNLTTTNFYCHYYMQYYLTEKGRKIALVNIHMAGNVLRSFPMILKPVPSKHMTYRIDDTNYILEADEATLEICEKYFNKYKAIGWKCTIKGETFNTWEQVKQYVLYKEQGKEYDLPEEKSTPKDKNVSTWAQLKDFLSPQKKSKISTE